MKPGDIVKCSDSWNSGKPPVVGIIVENGVVNNPYPHHSREKFKVLLPAGQLSWRFSFELEVIQ